MRVSLRDKITGTIVGGETYTVKKGNRIPFSASLIETTYDVVNNSTEYIAEDILEPATYRWIDANGNVLYEGLSAIISNGSNDSDCCLEVTSVRDGFRDYAEFSHELFQDNRIISLSPNPARTSIRIEYISNVDLVEFKIISISSAQQVLSSIANPQDSSHIINVDALPVGSNALLMVANNKVVCSKVFEKDL